MDSASAMLTAVAVKRVTVSRWFYFGLALFVAITASVIAFRQTLRSDPLNPPQFLSVDWWKYPLEVNAIRRVTLISSNIRDITVAPNTNTLWIAGQGGLLASSADGGQTWQMHEILDLAKSTTRPPAPSVTPSPSFGSTPATKSDNFPSAVPGPNPPPQFSASPAATRTPSSDKQASVEEKDDYRLAAVAPAEKTPSKNSQVKPSTQTQGPIQNTVPQTPQTPTPAPRRSPTSTPAPQHTVAPSPIPQATAAPTTPPQTTVAPTTTPQPILTPSPAPTSTPLSALESSGRIYPDLEAITFYDSQRGCAVGLNGTHVWTTDGGNTWGAQSSFDLPFIAVRFDSADQVTALARTGVFCTISEFPIGGGIKSKPISDEFESAFLVTGAESWGYTGSAILRARPFATGWTKTDATPPVFIPLETGLGHIGWAGFRGRLAKIRMLNQRPADPPSVPPNVKSILFPRNDSEAWAVGSEGTIMASTDAGKSWHTLAIASSPDLKKRREEAGNHHRFPAPWYYLACLLSLGLCLPGLRRPSNVLVEGTVADILASDRPIEPGEPDPLQFNAIALALSRFLRNSNTTPPLSIAITGEWGTGKSSLMNLLRGDLRARGFRPVWFNPWHHQKEEHLLAALLENIQAQAIPALFSFQGFCYRAFLVWFRARRYWRVSLFLAVLLAAFAGYFAAEPGRMEHVAAELRGFTTSIGEFISERLKKSEPPKSVVKSSAAPETSSAAKAAEKPAALTTAALQIIGDIFMPEANRPPGADQSHAPAAIVFVTSLIGALVALVKALRSFGVNPSSLLATSSDRPRLRDLKAETSFRYKFAREFADVTRALRGYDHRTMLILIDDLDRCRPESVVEMLEAVNFLITCGDCFIVLGMARERVERCVGLAFKDMAEEVFGGAVGDNVAKQDEERKKRRAEYARQYLEKLINIEVPVPAATSEQSRELLARDEEAGVRQRARKLRFAKARRAALLGAMTLLLIGAAFFAGKVFFPNRAVLTAITTAPPSEEAQNVTPPEPRADGSTPLPTSAPATLDSAVPGSTGAWALAPLIALLVAAGIWSAFLVPANMVYDSAEFTKALRLWQPIISRKRNTPRSLKRFLNRVRYLAMKQRSAEPVRTRWQAFWVRLRAWFGRAQEEPPPAEGDIKEGVLVGLCACKYLFPEKTIESAMLRVQQELTEDQEDLSPPEQELLDYLKSGFVLPATAAAAEFEKLHAGLHVY
jgi:KAP family P-loop domain